jgi:hypothetical protein
MQVTGVSAATPVRDATAESRRDPAAARTAPDTRAASATARHGELLYLEQAHAVAQLTDAAGPSTVGQLYRALAAGEMTGTLTGPGGQFTGYWLQVLV